MATFNITNTGINAANVRTIKEYKLPACSARLQTIMPIIERSGNIVNGFYLTKKYKKLDEDQVPRVIISKDSFKVLAGRFKNGFKEVFFPDRTNFKDFDSLEQITSSPFYKLPENTTGFSCISGGHYDECLYLFSSKLLVCINHYDICLARCGLWNRIEFIQETLTAY